MIGGLAWGQDQAAKFEAADVRIAAKIANPFVRTGPVRGGRYEIKSATMVDLIRIAHGFEPDKVVGGPNWLELDRFDVIGKVPEGSTAEQHKQMLQRLLAERFQLAGRPETRPMPAWALTAGKKPQLKEAEGSEETGCKPQTSAPAAPAEGGGAIRLSMMSAGGGAPVTLTLGPGMTVTYQCRNTTMAAFAGNLRGMIGANLGPHAILDETGLPGKYNFDIRYSMNLIGPMMADSGDRISIHAAIEKQLGLKLEEKQLPTQVFAVEKVNRDPGANPAGTAEALPPIASATEFEVASVKPVEGGAMMGGRFGMQPGGRFSAQGMPLRFLIDRAFNATTGEVLGIPQFASSDRYDVIAKLPPEFAEGASGGMDTEAMAPLLRKLLEDRFKMKHHVEEKPVTAYTLVASKPKMKKADPASRISCKNTAAPSGAPPGSRMLTCQNVTMAQFAERLQRLTPDLTWPVIDGTGLEGGWDLSLVFSFRPQMMMMGAAPMMSAAGAGGGPGGAGSAVPTAADPSGAQTIFEAIEKQLGLKLEKRPRTEKVIVIDHLEQRPTEN
jgi:uncharacterized protein (TIGR03435 family)